MVDKRKVQVQKLAWFDQICGDESIASMVARLLLVSLSEDSRECKDDKASLSAIYILGSETTEYETSREDFLPSFSKIYSLLAVGGLHDV